jgi:hypothetical protein
LNEYQTPGVKASFGRDLRQRGAGGPPRRRRNISECTFDCNHAPKSARNALDCSIALASRNPAWFASTACPSSTLQIADSTPCANAHARAVDVDAERVIKDREPPFDCLGRRDEIRSLIRIAQRGADLVFELADHALRVDRDPPPLLVTQHVVMLEVAMQQRGLALCGRELRVHALRVLDELARNLSVADREVALESET